jgi:hypothetical protein
LVWVLIITVLYVLPMTYIEEFKAWLTFHLYVFYSKMSEQLMICFRRQETLIRTIYIDRAKLRKTEEIVGWMFKCEKKEK